MANKIEGASCHLTLAAGCVAFQGAVELDRVNQEFVGLVWSRERR